MKKKQIKVIYKKNGLANYFGDYIEINENLKYNKPLRDYVVKHELGHSDEFDLIHEFKINWKLMPSLLKFIWKNPRTWIDFFPIQFRNNKIVYDLNLSLLYILIIIMIIILIKLFF